MQSTVSLLNLSAIENAPVSTDPYPFFVGQDFLNPDAMDDLRRDFPDIRKVEIPVARLAAYPAATLCVGCKSAAERR